MGERGGRFQSVGRVQDCEDDVLHEGEEDDTFDADEFEEEFVSTEVGTQADVEGEGVEDGDGNGDDADNFKLCGEWEVRKGL